MTAFSGSGPDSAHQADAGTRSIAPSETKNRPGIVVALGGGFARGFAHLGVLDVLEREQISIAAIVGTSIGGLLGAAYADGISVEELCDLGRKVRVRDFIRFHRRGYGEKQNDYIGAFVGDWFRASNVEELPIPTSIVTTDLSTCAPYIFTHGPLEVALRASCAFPGLFQPVEHEGRMLADGCIASPVPTAVAARMNARFIISVAIGPGGRNASPDRKAAQGLSTAFPEPYNALTEPSWARPDDLLIEPEVHQIGWTDFSRVDEARASGADAMRRALPYVREWLDRQLPEPAVSETLPCSETGLAR